MKSADKTSKLSNGKHDVKNFEFHSSVIFVFVAKFVFFLIFCHDATRDVSISCPKLEAILKNRVNAVHKNEDFVLICWF